MLKFAKAIHFIGLAMFLGSIMAHITVGFIPGGQESPDGILFSRHAISLATTFVTIPGLALLLISGLFMTFYGRLGVLKIRWLTAHQIIGTLIILNTVIFLVPLGHRLRAAAMEVGADELSLAAFHSAAAPEARFGAINLLLAIATVFIAVFKPGARRKQGEA